MTRVLLVVPDRSRGWRDGGIAPLLDPDEATAYAAFTSAGLNASVTAESALAGHSAVPGHLIVLIRPENEFLDRIERGIAANGGTLLVVHGESLETLKRVRDNGIVFLGSARGSIPIERRPRHGRATGWRSRLRPPSFHALRSAPTETVMATWSASGLPAVRLRVNGPARVFSLGFHPDHLSPSALLALLEMTGNQAIDASSLREPVPDHAPAVVLLLHDVEEALSDDPGGIASVIAGLEGSLDAEARHGFHATYNAVGSFAEKIPDLIGRIVAEGHELASHGATHRVVADLAPDALRQELQEGESRLERIAGTRVRGFRSPRSRWSDELLGLLAERGYRWNAEVDLSPFPYRPPGRRASSLLRIPVRVDDWDFVKHRASARRVLKSWEREVRWAIDRRSWIAIGSHPSVLGAAPDRLAMFGEFLGWLSSERVCVLTHDEGVSWWLKRTSLPASATDAVRLSTAGGPA